MKRFLSRRTPPLNRILLVESGSREVAERWLAWLRQQSPGASVDVVTCFEGLPDGADGERFDASRQRDWASRKQFLTLLDARRYDLQAVLATGEPLLARWKPLLITFVGAKVLLVNENADCFWLDRGHWRTAAGFLLFRLGLHGSGLWAQPLRLLLFPLTFSYLLFYAAKVHLRRRLLRW